MYQSYSVWFLVLIRLHSARADDSHSLYSDRRARTVRSINFEYNESVELFCTLNSADLADGVTSANLSFSIFLIQYGGVPYGSQVELINSTIHVSR